MISIRLALIQWCPKGVKNLKCMILPGEHEILPQFRDCFKYRTNVLSYKISQSLEPPRFLFGIVRSGWNYIKQASPHCCSSGREQIMISTTNHTNSSTGSLPITQSSPRLDAKGHIFWYWNSPPPPDVFATEIAPKVIVWKVDAILISIDCCTVIVWWQYRLFSMRHGLRLAAITFYGWLVWI